MGLTTVYRICAALAIAGAALFVWGLLTPTYYDNAGAYYLLTHDCGEAGHVQSDWFDRIDALRTSRWPLMNSGCSMVLLACTVSGLALWNVRRFREVWATPAKEGYFFAGGLLGLGLAWFGEVMAIWILIDRHLAPSCADTPAIPLMGLSFLFVLIGIVGLVSGLVLMRGFAALPVPLFAWDSARPVRSLWMSSYVLPVHALLLFVLANTCSSESFLAMPGYAILLYLAEAARSALVCSENASLSRVSGQGA